MVSQLSNALQYKHINEACDEALEYVQSRRNGTCISLKTPWGKFNDLAMGGIEPNALYTIGGISGSGKSSFINNLESSLFDLNPDQEFVVLNFNFEMLASKQVGRKLSKELKLTTSQLYSGISNYRLSKNDYEKVENALESIRTYPIYYVDCQGTVDEIRNTFYKFANEEHIKGKWIITILDHTLLTKGRLGEAERTTLAQLQKMFMEIRKFGKTSIIQLSQLNRSIEESDRINNPIMHYPTRKDIFGADSVYQASDYVIILHRPEILKIYEYGPNALDTKGIIFLHFIKNREGKLKILRFKENLKHNNIIEF